MPLAGTTLVVEPLRAGTIVLSGLLPTITISEKQVAITTTVAPATTLAARAVLMTVLAVVVAKVSPHSSSHNFFIWLTCLQRGIWPRTVIRSVSNSLKSLRRTLKVAAISDGNML